MNSQTRRDRRRPRRRSALVSDLLATASEVLIIVLTLAYLISTSPIALFAWEGAAALYIAVGFLLVTRQAKRGVDGGRVGALGVLSWVLPVLSSLAGVYSAVIALTGKAAVAPGDVEGQVLIVTATVGIVLSWLLLHTGVAQIYQSSYERHPNEPGLDFPSTPQPLLLDFLYFSFAIGAAFATSDTRVIARRMRRTVLIHSVVGFFYNAFVIAVAFQVLQELVGK